jgi:predicted glycoside hydrolase/deacetylase ChbG (UPF0249 family)/DNA-binding FrmR family transcriptional regulator
MNDIVIITADDLALSPQISAGICEAGRRGVVTEASVLVHSPWAAESIVQGQEAGLSIGLHLDLVSSFVEGCSPYFGPKRRFCTELLQREYEHQVGKLFSCDELIAIRDEMQDQIEEFARLTGQLPSHLDYHYGLHHLGEVMALYLTVAQEYDLPVRWGRQYAGASPYELAPTCICDGFRGREQGGLELFLKAVDEPCDSTKEVICHPGYATPVLAEPYNHERELELKTLTDPRLKEELARRQVRLVTYGWLKQHLSGTAAAARPRPREVMEMTDNGEVLFNGTAAENCEQVSLHEHQQSVINRLARIEGHVRAVKRMVEEGRSCPDILVQVAAVRSALNNVGRLILEDHLKSCMVDAVRRGDFEQAYQDLEHSLDRFIR